MPMDKPMKNRNARSRQRGFTLIEIMVVVVIIGVLSTLVLPRVLGRQEQAFVTKAQSDIQALTNALKLYKLDNFKFPTTDLGLESLVENPGAGARNWKEGGYIDRLPKDPWGNPYQYLSPGEHGTFDLWSFGPDGVSGGLQGDDDITNWEK
ncbi:MAG: type II secretion system protein G [marine bacterium B5-7]|nr:MAG: type II secretion system protein G [marine bacterium B5-7]